ncbi:hypothetical protein A0O34_03330 [Chryseobacterium glaciei]|uniref:Uncharacterized protein n=1 Tax=Chryseobacterium glaciei TaxID=1685010 RepID=A0A172XS27_9FLAO|nr:hypothetical protein [Chryseobacterium glaciei]ANF49635.1 hypothetical protein A0O34_03330 [Chryseobacterium glaciei]
MKYQKFNYTNKSEIEQMLNDGHNVSKLIIGAVNGVDDQLWLEELCTKYILNEDFGIARTAIYGVGDIARIYGKVLNFEIIKEKFAQIQDQRLKYVIQDVEDDFKIFLKE